MTQQEQEEFVEQWFRSLIERNVIKECIFSYSEEYHKEQCVMITPLPEVGTFETLEGWFNDDDETV